jgi:hypothetical protein
MFVLLLIEVLLQAAILAQSVGALDCDPWNRGNPESGDGYPWRLFQANFHMFQATPLIMKYFVIARPQAVAIHAGEPRPMDCRAALAMTQS